MTLKRRCMTVRISRAMVNTFRLPSILVVVGLQQRAGEGGRGNTFRLPSISVSWRVQQDCMDRIDGTGGGGCAVL
jgi:hypothetical protein